MRISALVLIRPAGLMSATCPSTRLPTGMISLPSATIACTTWPVNGSPVWLVFEVRVVVSRMRSVLPAGTVGLSLAPAAKAGVSETASRRPAAIHRVTRFIVPLLHPARAHAVAGRDSGASTSLHPGRYLYKARRRHR